MPAKMGGIQWIITAVLLTSMTSWRVHCEDETVSTLRGQSVVLTCPIDVTSCGELHSVKWFKGADRVAVVSGDGSVENVEGQYSGRMTIGHNPKGPSTKLNIKTVQVQDEDVYVCETTFLEPMENCENTGSYSIELKVHVPPSSIQILDESGNLILNSTTLGPLRENHRFTSICEIRGTRPAPMIGWYRAGKRLQDSATTDEANGLFSVKSVLSLVLSRQELGAFLECRVETPALENIVSNQLHIDLQVRPTKVELSGVKHHTVQGTNILLQCQVIGARPAANVTWYNNTQALDPESETDKRTITTKTEFKNDGTFETVSTLLFSATRFENGVSIRCEGDNVVMRDDLDKPLHDTLVLEVMYPPVVTVKPDNLTVNETGEFLLFCEYEANPASLKNVRWLRNRELVNQNQGRIEGGNPEQTALLIKDAARTDIGSYTCELENGIGIGASENDIDVDVNFVPSVELTMEPNIPIIENNEANVTLFCNVIEGNPTMLLKVRWFLDGQVLKELPECQQDTQQDDEDPLCGVNPNILLLENVGREFLGNYSCEGQNLAGWGPRSKENDLIVYYEPGNATLTHYPQIPSKRKSVTFRCSVEDGGNPNATRYRWLRGGSPVMDVVTPVWTVDPVGLDSRTNFSCYAYNEGGKGNPATIDLDVRAPQAFITKLQPYTGALFSTPGISLSCRVECVPQCTIYWLKDGVGIEDTNERYYIKETYLPAEPAVGDFESVLSVLHFNMSAWTDEKLDIYKDNANYSCASFSKSEGPGVRSATYFGVEYPPENTTISNQTISVEEGLQPPRVSCSAKAYPEPSYEWHRKDKVIAKGNVLYIYRNMTKDDDGPYECISFNKHGSHSATIHVNVLYKPNCTIERKEVNEEDTLVCKAFGNPPEMGFEWSIKNDNETINVPDIKSSESSSGQAASFLILSDNFNVQRIYRCAANNSVGIGTICEIEVAGHLAWWQRLSSLQLYILMGVIAVVLLAVIIICIIIICVCRKRRKQEKYHTDLNISATQSVLSVQQSPPPRPPPPPSEIPKSPPKWPLRPGVMVHVKVDTKQNLCASRTQSPSAIQYSTNASINAAAIAKTQSPNRPHNISNVSYASPLLNKTSTNVDTFVQIDGKDNVGIVSSTNGASVQLPQQPPPPPPPPALPARNLLSKFATSANTNTTSSTTVGELLTNRENGTDENCNNTTTTPNSNTNLTMPIASNNNDELITFTSSSLIEKILSRLRWRRERTKHTRTNTHGNSNNNNENCSNNLGEDDGLSIFSKSNRRAVSLLRGTGWFGSGKSTNSSTGLFDKDHHMNGITCDDGVVTYKRTPVAVRPVSSCATTNNINPNDTRQQNKNESTGINDKSSVAGDPLTEPGEYENLPFHGMQSAPNKFYSKANSTNSNVVRVAPRPKNPSTTYNYNLANSFPATTYSANFYPNNTNFPSYHVNSLNYPNYSSNDIQPSTVTGTSVVVGGGLVGGNHMIGNNNANVVNTVAYNPFLIKNTKAERKAISAMEKKFNSLKSIGVKKSPQFYSMRVNKCKRHHNNSSNNNSNSNNGNCNGMNVFGSESHQMLLANGNIISGGATTLAKTNTTNSIPYISSTSSSSHSNSNGGTKFDHQQQPLYENLTDSIQIHESSLNNENSFLSSIHDEFNCEPERNSIYRSDSGISNSSYECITPVPAPRTNQRKCQSAPVYMNLPNQHNNSNNNSSSNSSSAYHQRSNGGRMSGKSNKSNNHHHQVKHNSKCKNSLQNGGAFLSYERTQTNPFVTSSRRQQILVPKELFPINQLSQQNGNCSVNNIPLSSSSSSASSSARRPVKLPLRKHHSFHFQPSQTVAGAINKHKKHYKNNGPLVFKPFNEKSAFKPITPVPKSPNKSLINNIPSTTATTVSGGGNSINGLNTTPRICGTSLKRHMSNVETFQSSNRIEDENNFLTDDEDSTPSSSSASTTRGKRLHYADLAPLGAPSTLPNKLSSNNSSSYSSGGASDKNSNKNSNSADERIKMKNFKQNGVLPKRTTQYATLKFNEVNI